MHFREKTQSCQQLQLCCNFAAAGAFIVSGDAVSHCGVRPMRRFQLRVMSVDFKWLAMVSRLLRRFQLPAMLLSIAKWRPLGSCPLWRCFLGTAAEPPSGVPLAAEPLSTVHRFPSAVCILPSVRLKTTRRLRGLYLADIPPLRKTAFHTAPHSVSAIERMQFFRCRKPV